MAKVSAFVLDSLYIVILIKKISENLDILIVALDLDYNICLSREKHVGMKFHGLDIAFI